MNLARKRRTVAARRAESPGYTGDRIGRQMMDREIKEQRVQQPDGKVFHARDLEIEVRHQDRRYTCNHGDGQLTPTGQLVVFVLTPDCTTLPSFVARWDGGKRGPGNQERFDLDIDMLGKADDVWKFRKCRGGYCGHHTNRIFSTKGWGYDLLVKIPSGVIFDATCRFTLHRRVGLTLSGAGTVKCDAQVLRSLG
jgi:hypothetical protein